MRAIFLMLTALLTACSSASDVYRHQTSVAGKDAVIFLHGYYGSALREKNGGPRRFVRVSTVIGGKFAIALESDKLGLRPSPELEVEGLMAKVSVLPFYNNDVYGEFLQKLAREHTVVAFAYDWRKDLASAARELDAVVNKLQGEGARSVSLLAHSMGGLVSAYYLMYGAKRPEEATKADWAGAQRVAKVGFLGVPFGGAIALFRNMQHGTGYPWNETLLEGGTVASFPASYHLVPLLEARMVDPAGKELVVPLHDPDFWRQHRLGLLREAAAPAIAAYRQAYTAEQIGRAVRFQRSIHGNFPAPKTLRVLNVRGRGRATLARGYFDGREFIFLPRDAKKAGLPFGPLESDGDGSVPLEAAALPRAFSGKGIFTAFAHDRIFDDPAVEKECLDFFAGEN